MRIEVVVLINDHDHYHFAYDRTAVIPKDKALALCKDLLLQKPDIPFNDHTGRKSIAHIMGFKEDTAGNIGMLLETDSDIMMQPLIKSMAVHYNNLILREEAMEQNKSPDAPDTEGTKVDDKMDVNKDGKVNLLDATFILQAIKDHAGEDGVIDINDIEELHIQQVQEFRHLIDAIRSCDVDKSGKIDIADVEEILHHLYGVASDEAGDIKIPTKKRPDAAGRGSAVNEGDDTTAVDTDTPDEEGADVDPDEEAAKDAAESKNQ